MKSFGSKKVAVGAQALLLSVFVLYAPTSAHAVTTPSQYCATVAGCEILNVIGGGVAAPDPTSSSLSFLVVHYCKNMAYKAMPVREHNWNFDIYLGSYTAVPMPFTAATLCPILP
ncbi:MAG: hypothetical protein PHY92_02485 [Alphaproteobacteria bacterium]|nr:hypothetical protein [Alphaproteobacteria bacterium]